MLRIALLLTAAATLAASSSKDIGAPPESLAGKWISEFGDIILVTKPGAATYRGHDRSATYLSVKSSALLVVKLNSGPRYVVYATDEDGVYLLHHYPTGRGQVAIYRFTVQ